MEMSRLSRCPVIHRKTMNTNETTKTKKNPLSGISKRAWCFTYFGEVKDVPTYFSDVDVNLYKEIGYQQERCPSSGRLHLQGYVLFAEPLRWKQVQTRLHIPGAHLEACVANVRMNRLYCSKAETRVAGPVQLVGKELTAAQKKKAETTGLSTSDVKVTVKDWKEMTTEEKWKEVKALKPEKGMSPDEIRKKRLEEKNWPPEKLAFWKVEREKRYHDAQCCCLRMIDKKHNKERDWYSPGRWAMWKDFHVGERCGGMGSCRCEAEELGRATAKAEHVAHIEVSETEVGMSGLGY